MKQKEQLTEELDALNLQQQTRELDQLKHELELAESNIESFTARIQGLQLVFLISDQSRIGKK